MDTNDENVPVPGVATMLAANHAQELLRSAAVTLTIAQDCARSDGAHRLADDLVVISKAALSEERAVNAAMSRLFKGGHDEDDWLA